MEGDQGGGCETTFVLERGKKRRGRGEGKKGPKMVLGGPYIYLT